MEGSVAEKLCTIQEKVAARIGANCFRTWFGGATSLKLDGTCLDVRVPNPFIGNWIAAKFMPHLRDVSRDVLGAEPQIEIRVAAGEPPGETGGRPGAESAASRPGVRGLERVPLRGELEDFVVGRSNELAWSVANAVVRSPGESFKHVVIHGGCGLGKTHLLHGICNGVDRTQPTLEWRFVSGEEFTNEFILAVKNGRLDAFRARFRNVDVLVIDDIHFLANKKATQEEFLHTFNAIDAVGKAVVMSCDRHPRQIAALSEPLMDRLLAAMIVQIEAPDFETRREILRRRAAKMLVELAPEVLDYVARNVTRNVRELEGALYKLGAYAALTRECIGLEAACRALEDYIVMQPAAAEDIVRRSGGFFNISPELLRSKSRDRTVTTARGIAMYLVRKHTEMSLPEIGRLFGNKQHSTVLMAVRRIQNLIDRDGAVAWKAPAGPRTLPVRTVLEQLEQRLFRGPAGA